MNDKYNSNAKNDAANSLGIVPPDHIKMDVQMQECISCCEEINLLAKKCPYCNSLQGKLRVYTVWFKWVIGVLTLITFIFGARQLVKMALGSFEEKHIIETRLLASEALCRVKEYGAAWKQLDAAYSLVPGNIELDNLRFRLARSWLLNASVISGVSTFKDITDNVTPVIAYFAESESDSSRAASKALLAYAQYLRSREEIYHGDLTSIYRDALTIDPDCTLAHLLLGHYLVSYSEDLDAGLNHLAKAVELVSTEPLEGISVRKWQLNSIDNYIGGFSFINQQNIKSLYKGYFALIRVVNEMRQNGEMLPEEENEMFASRNRHWEIICRVYDSASKHKPELFDSLLHVIATEEHLATLKWLQKQFSKKYPTPLFVAMARLQEELGDTSGAVVSWNSFKSNFWFEEKRDEALLRLTGKPYRPLKARDQWAHLIQIIGSENFDSKEFVQAMDMLNKYVESHNVGMRDFDEKALKAVNAGLENIFGLKLTDSTSELQDIAFRLILYRGKLLLASGQIKDAFSTLDQWYTQIPSGHPVRSELLIVLAVVHAQRVIVSLDKDSERRKGVALLREAVEVEHYADWARIRWSKDLEPLYSSTEYADFLKNHGRKVEWFDIEEVSVND